MKAFWFLFIFSCFLCQANEFKYNLTIAAIFQNEASYLNEWIEYHQKVGVDYFILFNNDSNDEYQEVLEPYIKRGIVKLIQWPSEYLYDEAFNNFCFLVTPKAYIQALRLTQKTTKWLALIDIDEYIVPVLDATVVECLEKRFSQVSGLAINWQCYGTSHIEKLSESKPLISQLLWKAPQDDARNRYCKSIVNPRHVKECIQPHGCVFHAGYFSVDAKNRPCDGFAETVEIDTIRINHYWTKDEWFLRNEKIPRYNKWGTPTEDILKLADSLNEVYDPILEDFMR